VRELSFGFLLRSKAIRIEALYQAFMPVSQMGGAISLPLSNSHMTPGAGQVHKVEMNLLCWRHDSKRVQESKMKQK
jgi:hypothetical protein